VNHDGKVSAAEVANFVAKKRADRARLVAALSVLVVLLAVSYVAVGGIVFYVVKLIKDTQVTAGELTDTSGETVHVMSTAKTSIATGLTSNLADGAFEGLQSVTATTTSGTSVTLGLSGYARTGSVVTLFTTSAAVPTLVLTATSLSLGADASAAALAALGIAPGTSSSSAGGGRRLSYSQLATCSSDTTCASYIFATKSSGNVCPAGAYYCLKCASSNNGGLGRCVTCPTGTYVNAAACTGAAAGTAGDTTKCHAVTSCSSIIAGYIGVSGVYSGSSASSWYTTSALTTYTAAGVQSVSACPAGSYATSLAGSTPTACLMCTATSGFYCPAATATAGGAACPQYYTCAGGANAPVLTPVVMSTACAAGTYSTSGFAPCTTCEAGFYCKGGTSHSLCATLGSTYMSRAGSSTCCNSCVYEVASLPSFVSTGITTGTSSYCAYTYNVGSVTTTACGVNTGSGACNMYYSPMTCYASPP